MPFKCRFLFPLSPVKNLWRANTFTFSSLVIRIYLKNDFSVLCPVMSMIRNGMIPARYILVAAVLLAVCDEIN